MKKKKNSKTKKSTCILMWGASEEETLYWKYKQTNKKLNEYPPKNDIGERAQRKKEEEFI